MAAATTQTVYCLEHSRVYYERLKELVNESGVNNVAVCLCPIKGGWYDLSETDLPAHFAIGLNDGPSRQLGHRMGFFDHFDADVIVCDDVDDFAYRAQVMARMSGRQISTIEPRTMIIKNG
jgi:hypothetical protein